MSSNNNEEPEKHKLVNKKTNELSNNRIPSKLQFNVIRKVYLQEDLNIDASYIYPEKSFGRKCMKLVKQCGFDHCLANLLPILNWLPNYDFKKCLVSDLTAGSTTAVMHIPQGMAYAMLAEVPPIVGLYMAFFPVLVYVVFGTSPHVSMGTFAVACLMSGKVVSQYAIYEELQPMNGSMSQNDTSTADPTNLYHPEEVLSVVCIAVGIIELLMWTCRLGAVSALLSEPLISGFTTAASLQVLASQIKDLLGIKTKKISSYYKIILTLIETFNHIPHVNWMAITISLLTCAIIIVNNECFKPWVSKKTRFPIPIELIVVIIGTMASRFGDLNKNYGISLIGHIPTGLPVPSKLPPLELFPAVALDAFAITMVTYTISMSMALIFATKEKYEIDANQELLALGASNVFGAFFSCAPMCASLSRSYIQYQAGAKTQMTSVISAILILFVLLWIGPLFEELPRCVLASIIVVALKGLYMQVMDLYKFMKLSKLDGSVWIITFLVTALISIDVGLIAGLIASLGTLFFRSQTPYTCLLGNVANTDLYLDIKRYRAAKEIPKVKIFHYCGGLNFATKNLFRDCIYRKIGLMKPIQNNKFMLTESYKYDPNLSETVDTVIIDASALSYLDAPGIKTLIAIENDLNNCNIQVLLSGANGPALEMIHAYNALEPERLQIEVFATVHDAVTYYKMVENTKLSEDGSRDSRVSLH